MTAGAATRSGPVSREPAGPHAHRPGSPDAPTHRGRDALVALGYLAAAIAFSQRLLLDLSGRAPLENGGDHTLFQWMLARAATVVTQGANPFFADRLNAPDGVNLMANTSALGLGIPLTPVTLLFGPQVSYAVILILGLAGTAFGWYWVLHRRLGISRPAAAVAGAFCGFAPGLIAHTEGHLNWTAQLLVPVIVERLFRLRDGDRTVRDGLILGALIVYQVFITEEVLLYTAIGAAVFGTAYALSDWSRTRSQWRPFLRGIGVAVAVAAPLLAYPIWLQFRGPQSYQGVPEHATELGNDVAAMVAYSRQSLAGSTDVARRLAANATEENSFFGWALAIVVVVAVAWLWRDQIVRAAAVTAAVFLLLSLGPKIVVNGHDTGIAGPWAPFAHLPVLDSVVPSRLSLIAIPCLAAILAVFLDRIRGLANVAGRRAGILRWAALAAVAAALVPLIPTPLPTRQMPVIPAFAVHSGWTGYQAGGHHIVIAGGRGPLDYTGMRWAARYGMDLSLVGGLFLGPGGKDGRAQYGAPQRPTTKLLIGVATTGTVPPILDQQRAEARSDVRFWHAGAIVLPLSVTHVDEIGAVLTSLLGDPGTVRDGVRVWDVRAIADAP